MLSIRAKSLRKMGGRTGNPFPRFPQETSKFVKFPLVTAAGFGLFTEKFENKAETEEYFVAKSSY